jgi:oligopeptide/dipeptide ABC transporter ATP-binding protein
LGVGKSTFTSEESLAQVCDLTVTYCPEGQPPVPALDSVNLDIRSGEVIGILGESGSGKSTLALALLRLLPGHAQYNRGTVRFLGHDLSSLSESELGKLRGAEIALVPQDPSLTLNPVMRVGTQISEVLRAHAELTRSQRSDRVAELLQEVGFENPAQIGSAYPHQLSGGQRQRVAIAQAIACRPALVIADEPTSKLDASLQADIVGLMADIRERHGVAFIVISHDPALFWDFADRIAVMYAGQIVEQGTTENIYQRPLHPYTQALVALARSCSGSFSGQSRRQLPMIVGEPADLTCGIFGCRFEPRCPERMQICACRDPEELTPTPSHHVSCFKYGD